MIVYKFMFAELMLKIDVVHVLKFVTINYASDSVFLLSEVMCVKYVGVDWSFFVIYNFVECVKNFYFHSCVMIIVSEEFCDC